MAWMKPWRAAGRQKAKSQDMRTEKIESFQASWCDYSQAGGDGAEGNVIQEGVAGS